MRPICRRNQQWLTGKRAAAAAANGGDAMDAIMRRAGNLSGGEQTVIELCARARGENATLISLLLLRRHAVCAPPMKTARSRSHGT